VIDLTGGKARDLWKAIDPHFHDAAGRVGFLAAEGSATKGTSVKFDDPNRTGRGMAGRRR